MGKDVADMTAAKGREEVDGDVDMDVDIDTDVDVVDVVCDRSWAER